MLPLPPDPEDPRRLPSPLAPEPFDPDEELDEEPRADVTAALIPDEPLLGEVGDPPKAEVIADLIPDATELPEVLLLASAPASKRMSRTEQESLMMLLVPPRSDSALRWFGGPVTIQSVGCVVRNKKCCALMC